MKVYTVIIHRSDRIMWLRLNADDTINGVNYMQGASDIDHFSDYMEPDEELTKFVNALISNPQFKGNIIDKVDDIIWIHCQLVQEDIL